VTEVDNAEVSSRESTLTLIHGDERFLVEAAVRQWREQAAAGHELAVEIIDAPSKLGEVGNSLMEVPLFDPQRFLLIRDPPQLAGRQRKGADGAEALATLLEQRSPTTSVCLAVHATVAPTNPVLAAVRKLGGTIHLHSAPKGRDLQGWIEAAVRVRGLRLAPGVTAHLLRVAGPDLGALSGELDKLLAFGGGDPVSLADACGLIAGDERVQMWSVMDGLLGTSPGRGAAAINSLIDEGRPAQYLLATLAGQVRELLVTQALLGRPNAGPASVATALGVPPWRADRLARQARGVPHTVTAEWLRALQRLDARVKAGEAGDADGLRAFGLGAARAVISARAGASRRRPGSSR